MGVRVSEPEGYNPIRPMKATGTKLTTLYRKASGQSSEVIPQE